MALRKLSLVIVCVAPAALCSVMHLSSLQFKHNVVSEAKVRTRRITRREKLTLKQNWSFRFKDKESDVSTQQLSLPWHVGCVCVTYMWDVGSEEETGFKSKSFQ